MNQVEIAEKYVQKAKNAKSRRMEFSMSLYSFSNIVTQTHCAYSGIKFDKKDNILSLERIDNSIGYVDGNVIPVILKLNNIRDSHTLESIELEIDSIKAELDKKFVNANSIENSITQNIDIDTVKKRFTYKTYRKYMHYYNISKSLEKKIKRFGKNKELKDELTKVKHTLSSIVHGAPYNLNKSQLKDLNRAKALKSVNNSIKSDMEKLKQLRLIKQGLSKFTNMSDADKYLVSAGLPLDTSKFKMLKHKVGCSLLINKI